MRIGCREGAELWEEHDELGQTTIRERASVAGSEAKASNSLARLKDDLNRTLQKRGINEEKLVNHILGCEDCRRAVHRPTIEIDPEQLVYWYFRLNGFLTTVNFVVHDEETEEQRTEVDLVGVRFKDRQELLVDPMKDDCEFSRQETPVLFVIAEVSKTKCKLNGPWTKQNLRNLDRVLSAFGMVSKSTDSIRRASERVYNEGSHSGSFSMIRLIAVGRERSSSLKSFYPNVQQILFSEIASFVFERFDEYSLQKVSHPQWDGLGKMLWNIFGQSESKMEFVKTVLAHLET